MAVMQALVVFALVLQFSLLFRPLRSFVVRPFFEDTFYSLTASYWLAEGKGMSIDGVHPTNGVQPLICFLYLPSYWITGGDRLEALVPVMATQLLIYTGAVFAVAAFAAGLSRTSDHRRTLFWLVAMLGSWSMPMRHHMLNGLETGLAIGMAFGTSAYYNLLIERRNQSWRRWASLGVLFGISVLARIDIAFLVGAICLWHWLRPGHRTVERLAQAIVIGSVAVLVSLPWWIYNVSEFGSLMPISGQAQISVVSDRWILVRTSIVFVLDAFVLTFHTPVHLIIHLPWLSLATLLVVTGGAVIIGRSVRHLPVGWHHWRIRWDMGRAMPLALFALALIVYYTLFFGSPHFMSRYLLPERVLVGVLTIPLLYEIYDVSTRLTRRLFIVAIGASMILTAHYSSWDYTGKPGNSTVCRVDWIKRNCTNGERIAMFQSGTAGYLCDNVTNLDGKVNALALRALQRGTLSEYLIEQRFDVLMDWGVMMDPVLADKRLARMYTWTDRLIDMSDVYRLKPEFRKRN